MHILSAHVLQLEQLERGTSKYCRSTAEHCLYAILQWYHKRRSFHIFIFFPFFQQCVNQSRLTRTVTEFWDKILSDISIITTLNCTVLLIFSCGRSHYVLFKGWFSVKQYIYCEKWFDIKTFRRCYMICYTTIRKCTWEWTGKMQHITVTAITVPVQSLTGRVERLGDERCMKIFIISGYIWWIGKATNYCGTVKHKCKGMPEDFYSMTLKNLNMSARLRGW
jgi:hypothetical protein